MTSGGTVLADAWSAGPSASAHVEATDASGAHLGGHADDCALCHAWQTPAVVASAAPACGVDSTRWVSVALRDGALPDGRHRSDEARGPPVRG